MPNCTGTMTFQCQSGGQPKIDALGVCIKCYAHARATRKAYDAQTHDTVANGPWAQRRQTNADWRLGTLKAKSSDDLDTARKIGKEIYESLTNKITTDADTPVQDLADVSSMVGTLNDAADTLLQGNPGSECVAVCLVGRTLIVGANAALASKQSTLKSVMGGINDNILGKDSALQRVILLGAAQPSVLGPHPQPLPPLDTRTNVHAEIRILELLHLTVAVDGQQVLQRNNNGNALQMNGNTGEPLGWWDFTKKIYFGVDRPCCAKCYTTITAYNNGGFLAPYVFKFRGYHKMYPFEWRLPTGLKMLRTTIEYNKLKYATR